MSNVFTKPKPPAYVAPPSTATSPDATDSTISRSANFASRANADSFIGGKLTRKANTVKSELTGG